MNRSAIFRLNFGCVVPHMRDIVKSLFIFFTGDKGYKEGNVIVVRLSLPKPFFWNLNIALRQAQADIVEV